MNKKNLSERDICTPVIVPALQQAKHLRVGTVERLAVPFPPLAEQHRIVAARAEHAQLAEALVVQAVVA